MDCNNYCGITLLCFQGKVSVHPLLNCIRNHTIQTKCPDQAGLTLRRSTLDRILGQRVLIECRLEYQRGFIAAYVLTFESVDR